MLIFRFAGHPSNLKSFSRKSSNFLIQNTVYSTSIKKKVYFPVPQGSLWVIANHLCLGNRGDPGPIILPQNQLSFWPSGCFPALWFALIRVFLLPITFHFAIGTQVSLWWGAQSPSICPSPLIPLYLIQKNGGGS